MIICCVSSNEQRYRSNNNTCLLHKLQPGADVKLISGYYQYLLDITDDTEGAGITSSLKNTLEPFIN